MKDRPVGLVILWWAETIIALRVLLFAIPVFIIKARAGNSLPSDPESRFIILLTATAVLYFLVGLASIARVGFWKKIHYAAAALTALLTAKAVAGAGQAGLEAHYLYPAIVAGTVTVLVIFLGRKRPTVTAG